MKSKFFVVLAAVSLFLAGCYINDDVKTDQMAVKTKGGRILECVGPGVYTDLSFFADLKEVSAATVTFGVEDPEVATSDNQLVGVAITIQARRKADCDSLRNLFTNWSPLLRDENLVATVSATAREGIKVGTRTFTLAQLLDDRNGLSMKITEALEGDAGKYSVDIVNVTIENIALAPEYAQILQSKALLTAQIEEAQRKQDLIKQQADNDKLDQEQRQLVLEQQLLAERAQTDVQVEIASRAGRETAAKFAVYLDNEAAFELEKLRLLKDILGDQAVLYFIPQGTDITVLLNQLTSGAPQVVPISPEAGP